MSDPFRSELEAAHARIEKLEADHKARVAELEKENARLRRRLVDAAPPSHSKTGKTFFSIGMMTLGISLVGGMIFARTVKPPAPRPIFELPVEIPNAMELGDESPDPGDFDREATASALKGVRLADCAEHGSGHVKLVVAGSGVVMDAKIDRGSFSDGEKRCIEGHFHDAHLPKFTGAMRTIGKTFSF